MPIIYGVDSTAPANTRLTNGYLLYDWVIRKSCYPSFWGRTLTGKSAIIESEIEFLKSKNCKIALMLQNFTELEISSNNGTKSAMRAIELAKSKKIPQNKEIALFVYINPEWSVNHNWMMGFANTLLNNGYIAGFMGNTDSSKNFNFGRQCSHYIQATRDFDEYHAVYWSLEPKYKFEPDKWAPYAPSKILPKDMHLWQYGTIDFHSISANKNYVRDESVMKHFL